MFSVRKSMRQSAQRGKAATNGPRLCPEDQPQRMTNRKRIVRIPSGSVAIEPLRLGFATAAVREICASRDDSDRY